jgi:hypothetical protein
MGKADSFSCHDHMLLLESHSKQSQGAEEGGAQKSLSEDIPLIWVPVSLCFRLEIR